MKPTIALCGVLSALIPACSSDLTVPAMIDAPLDKTPDGGGASDAPAVAAPAMARETVPASEGDETEASGATSMVRATACRCRSNFEEGILSTRPTLFARAYKGPSSSNASSSRAAHAATSG